MELKELTNEELADRLRQKIEKYEESGEIQKLLLEQVGILREEIQDILNVIEARNGEENRT